eukprot:1407510-Amphidinium_carterae.2
MFPLSKQSVLSTIVVPFTIGPYGEKISDDSPGTSLAAFQAHVPERGQQQLADAHSHARTYGIGGPSSTPLSIAHASGEILCVPTWLKTEMEHDSATLFQGTRTHTSSSARCFEEISHSTIQCTPT